MSTTTLTITHTEAQSLVKQIRQKAGELAEAIRRLRDSKGWAVLGYSSWAECCEAEFGYSKQHANRLIKAEQIKLEVEPMGSTQPNERQARELARLPESQRSDCWQDVLDAAEQTGEKPTARAVQEKVDLWLADDEPIAVDVPVDVDIDHGDGVDGEDVAHAKAKVVASVGKYEAGLREWATENGNDLLRAKELLDHRNFIPWVKKEFGWSAETARRIMQAAENPDCITFVELEKLYLLATKNMPRNEPVEAAADQGEEFDVDARGDRLCDWLRHELDQWPQEHLGEALHWIVQIATKEFKA